MAAVQDEVKRLLECPHRRKHGCHTYGCGKVDVESKSLVRVSLGECDRCWKAGPETEEAKAMRERWVEEPPEEKKVAVAVPAKKVVVRPEVRARAARETNPRTMAHKQDEERTAKKDGAGGQGLQLFDAGMGEVRLGGMLRGRPVFLVMNGPSAAKVDLSLLGRRGLVSMGVNNGWSVFRPNLWACVDGPERFLDTGWKDPGILKFTPTSAVDKPLRVKKGDGTFRKSAFKVKQMPSVLFFRRVNQFDERTFLTGGGAQWGGMQGQKDTLGVEGKRSVMLVALRILHHLGAGRVYLVGCDFRMSETEKYAFEQERVKSAIKHNNSLYDALGKRFDVLRPVLEKGGMKVMNCTEGSGLKAFEFVGYEEAVRRESADCEKKVSTEGWYSPWEDKKK